MKNFEQLISEQLSQDLSFIFILFDRNDNQIFIKCVLNIVISDTFKTLKFLTVPCYSASTFHAVRTYME